jgi:hypothetical protein
MLIGFWICVSSATSWTVNPAGALKRVSCSAAESGLGSLSLSCCAIPADAKENEHSIEKRRFIMTVLVVATAHAVRNRCTGQILEPTISLVIIS